MLLVVASGAFGWLTGPTPDKLHREALAIVREYGFVQVEPGYLINYAPGFSAPEYYEAKGLDESEIKRIEERLDSACKGGTRSEITKGGTGTMWHSDDSQSLALYVYFYTSPGGDVVSLNIQLQDKRF